MLLHASKTAGLFLRAADSLISGAGSAVKGTGKLTGKVLGRVGKTVWKHPRTSIALAAGTGMTGAAVAEGMRRASQGMEPPYPQQRPPSMYTLR